MDPVPFPKNKQSLRFRAFNLIKERSFSRGEFTLTSGRVSKYYLDLKPTMFHPEGSNLLAALIVERLEAVDADYVGGLAMGAVPLVSVVTMASASKRKPLHGFVVRQQVKDHGTKKRIETAGDLSGKNVVILDDVTTTGGSAMEAVQAAKEVGANVLMVLAVVDREEGATAFYQREGIPFEALFTASEFLNS